MPTPTIENRCPPQGFRYPDDFLLDPNADRGIFVAGGPTLYYCKAMAEGKLGPYNSGFWYFTKAGKAKADKGGSVPAAPTGVAVAAPSSIPAPPSRTIRITGVLQPVTIYGTFSPAVESLLADGWISVFDVWTLSPPRSLMTAAEVFYAFLNGRPLESSWKSTPRDKWTPADRLNLGIDAPVGQLVIGQLTQSCGLLATDEIPGNRFDFWLRAGAQAHTPNGGRLLAQSLFAKIDSEPAIANDDKRFLKALILIKLTRGMPSMVLTWGGIPPLTEAQHRLWVAALWRIRGNNYRALSNWAFASLPLLGTPVNAVPVSLLP